LLRGERNYWAGRRIHVKKADWRGRREMGKGKKGAREEISPTNRNKGGSTRET